MTITYFEAWRLWFAGQLTGEHILFGQTVQMWGRTGKLLTFISGIVLVLDLVGKERVQRFGQGLRGKIDINGSIKSIWRNNMWVWLFIRYMVTLDKSKALQLRDKMYHEHGHTNLVINVVLSTVYSLWFVSYNFAHQNVAIQFIAFALFFSLFFTFFGSTIVFMIRLVVSAIAIVLGLLIIEPLAWILSRPDLEKLIKVGSILFLLIGFHFDFLAS